MRIETPGQFVHAGAFSVVLLCWIALGCVFLYHAGGPRPKAKRRERSSIAGIVLQALAFALAWGVQRPILTPFTPAHPAPGLALAGAAVLLSVASTWLTISAVRVLGRQWSFQARLVEGHRLVTEGPYGFVRHPIYTGMLGMLAATCLAVGHWIALAPALIFYGAGTVIRVRSEERLLRQAFGREFEEYARRVPAVVPGLR